MASSTPGFAVLSAWAWSRTAECHSVDRGILPSHWEVPHQGERPRASRGRDGGVIDIELVRLHLMELSSGEYIPTGRVVAFANTILFETDGRPIQADSRYQLPLARNRPQVIPWYGTCLC